MEFDESGVRKDRTEDWKQCLVVNLQETEPMVADMVQDPDWGEYWDLCLENTLLAQDWSKESYHVEENNCFTFVLTFLKMLNQHPFTGKTSIFLFTLSSFYFTRLGQFPGVVLPEADLAQDSPGGQVHHALQEVREK